MDLDEVMQLIEDCTNRDKKLTAWEHDFIVSIKTQLEVKGSLSSKQLDILNGIWDKVTA